MTDSETETRQQEIERDSLQGVISQMQGALLFAPADARPALETAMRNASARLGAVEKKIQELQIARETEVREAASSAVLLAEKETRLNAQERETFAGFLKEGFFTKADFVRLENFYAKSWDRLSEHGKDEMSLRVWGGIRHGEYTFDQLPPTVREKEAKQVYRRLHDSAIGLDEAKAIPERDREDFMRAYEAGKRNEAEKVLERESFKRNMFGGSESAARSHVAADLGREGEKSVGTANVANGAAPGKAPRAAEGTRGGAKDLSKFALDGVQLVETDSQGTSADIPNGRTAATRQSRSTPGG